MPRQCPKCLRHSEKIRVVETDPKTKKKWSILTCPDCKYKSDLEEYKRPSRNTSTSFLYETPEEDLDDGGEEDIN